MTGTIDEIRTFLQSRADSVLEGLKCTQPEEVDEDGDGFSGCGEDCDDQDPSVFPGAPEVCNLRDDNCDDQVDEGGECPTCVPETILGDDYVFCFNALPFADAEADCVSQGGHLASVHDPELDQQLWEAAVEIKASSWWFGLHDQDEEGAFVWTDGTPFDYDAWGNGEPNDAGSEDCAHWADWTGGQWNDIPCDYEIPYVCKL